MFGRKKKQSNKNALYAERSLDGNVNVYSWNCKIITAGNAQLFINGEENVALSLIYKKSTL